MINDATRELKLSAKLYVLYNPYNPIADGYYSSSSTVQDPENLNPINRNSQQDKFQTLGGVKYNLKPSFFQNIPNLMNAHIPPVNVEIGAPRCTFSYGSIVPGEIHPIYNLLKGPTKEQGYNPNFIKPDAIISSAIGNTTGTGGTSGTGITENKMVDRSIPIIPYSIKNYYGSSNILTTYNIWGIVDPANIDSLSTIDCKKYEGQITKTATKKDAPLLQTKTDINGESTIKFESPKAISYCKRLFPLKYDAAYDDNAYVYAVKTTNSDSNFSTQQEQKIIAKKVIEKGGANNSFHLSISPTFDQNNENGIQSQINIRIGKASKQYNNLAYQLEINPNKVKFYAITPDGQFLEQKFNGGIPSGGLSIELFMHFINDIVLVGFTPDPSQWNSIFPISQDKFLENNKNKFINYLPEDATIYIENRYASCEIQYGALAFNNFDPNPQSTVYEPYITFQHNTEYPLFTFTPYNGYKDVKENGTSHYEDTRSGSSQVQFINAYVNKGYGQIKFNSVIGGPIFQKIENNFTYKPQSRTYELAPDNSLLYLTGSNHNPFDPKAFDITEYLEGWTVNYDQNYSNLIFSTAEVTLKNFDVGRDPSTYDYKFSGMNILSLIEKNMIVLELSAGYGDESNIFFQGFIKGTKTTRTASESVTTFTCTDVGQEVLEASQFKNFVLFAGSKIRFAIQRCFEHSGFHPYFRLYDNKGYVNSIEANMSYTQLESKQIQCTQGEPIIGKLEMLLDKFITKQEERPFLRFNYSRQLFEMDWRYDSIYRDNLKLFGIDLRDANTRNAYFSKNLQDWHGLLTGPYTVSTQNGNFYKFFEARGFGYEGFISARKVVPQEAMFESILNGNYTPNAYVGFEKSFYKSLGNLFPDSLAVNTWLRNKLNILLKPQFSLNFTCYVKRPLNVHGSFIVESMWNNTTRVTDAYLYTNVSYKCDKANNIITATVTGRQAFISE